jgi:hypothetical protein
MSKAGVWRRWADQREREIHHIAAAKQIDQQRRCDADRCQLVVVEDHRRGLVARGLRTAAATERRPPRSTSERWTL